MSISAVSLRINSGNTLKKKEREKVSKKIELLTGKFKLDFILMCDSSISSSIRVCLCLMWGLINPLTPNDPYKGRTAPLTSKVAFYIFIQQI